LGSVAYWPKYLKNSQFWLKEENSREYSGIRDGNCAVFFFQPQPGAGRHQTTATGGCCQVVSATPARQWANGDRSD